MKEQKSWFEDWFDTALYYELYAGRNDADASRLIDVINPFLKRPPARVLDLACGRGRHAINLAKLGYSVTGSDISTSALAFARENAHRLNLEIAFIQADMRQPIEGTFHIIVNLFTSFGYFESNHENEQVIAHVANALVPGGMFVIDFFNASYLEKHLVHSEKGLFSAGSFEIHRFFAEGAVHKIITINDRSDEPKEFKERVALLHSHWFFATTEKYGLELVATKGDYDGNDFDSVLSPRFIGIFQRKHANI